MSDPVWLALWIITGLMVGALEYIALRRPAEGDTLSENLRAGVTRRPWIRWVTLIAWVVFSAWFAWHIWLT